MYFYISLVIAFIADIFSKQLALKYLDEPISIIGNFLSLYYVENDGVAFSINIPFLKILTIILIFAIFYYYFSSEKGKKNNYIDIAFGLILAGALGNAVERVFQGYVIDFIAVSGFSVFNLADSFITIGAGIYIVTMLFEKKTLTTNK